MARTWTEIRQQIYEGGAQGLANPLTPSESIAYQVMRELDNRRGLTRELDEEIKDDIFEHIATIVRETYPERG